MTINQYRKQIRLSHESCKVPGLVWHVTNNVKDRATPVFADDTLAGATCRTIERRAFARDADLLLYCLIPDHLHAMIAVRSTSLIEVVGEMKSNVTCEWWRRRGSGQLCKRSFYDHGIRNIQDGDAIGSYILENRVKAGLCESWEAYPYIGGTLVSGS